MRTDLTMLCTAAMALIAAACAPEPESGVDDAVIAHHVDDSSMGDTTEDDAVAGKSGSGGPAPGGLTGIVQNSDGAPVAGAFIEVDCVSEPCPAMPAIGVLSNESGHFRSPLPPGRFRVLARFQDRVSTPVDVTVLEKDTPPITLTLEPGSR